MDTDIGQIAQYIELSNGGDQDARRLLFEVANSRLHRIAGKMLRGYPGVKRWEETDDLWQNAGLKLWESLDRVELQDVRHFFSLAAVHIRRELVDLTRRYYGPQGQGANHATTEAKLQEDGGVLPAYENSSDTLEGRQLAIWTEFHEFASKLPDEEREVFDLLWYQGISQPVAATLLDVSLRTIKRRWQTARLSIAEQLKQPLPEI